MSEELKQQQELQNRIAEMDSAVKSLMTKEAVQRYTNIKIAFPEKAVNLLILLSQRVRKGKTDEITDEEVKDYLKMMENTKRDFRINKV